MSFQANGGLVTQGVHVNGFDGIVNAAPHGSPRNAFKYTVQPKSAHNNQNTQQSVAGCSHRSVVLQCEGTYGEYKAGQVHVYLDKCRHRYTKITRNPLSLSS